MLKILIQTIKEMANEYKPQIIMTKLPFGWISTKLGKILYVKNGFAFKSSNYSKSGVPIIRISDIKNGTITTDSSKKIKASDEINDFIIYENDILIALSGATTGKFGIYQSKGISYQNQLVGNLKLFSDKLIDKKCGHPS